MNTSSATTPAGSVEFFDGAVDLGAGSAPSGTGASVTSTFTTTALPAGVDAITAKYTPTPGATYVASQGSLNQTVNVLVVSDLVVSDFAGQGVWGYSPSGGWQQLMSANASLLAVNANGDVAAEFPGYGVYHYTEATEAWLQLTTYNATLLEIDSSGNVYADLAAAGPAGPGIYEYSSPTNFKKLTPANATVMAVDAGGDLVADFPGYGVQVLKNGAGSFVQINGVDASQLAMDTAGDVFAEFPGYGIGEYTGGTWKTLTPANASLLAADAAGDVTAVFQGYGVQELKHGAGSFTVLSSNSNVSLLAMGATTGDVFVDFPGSGMYLWKGGVNPFIRLTVSGISNPSQDAAGDVFGVVSGQGIWRFTLANGWQQLHPVTPALMAVDTLGDVAAVFSGYGTYLYSHTTQTWKQIHPLSASLLSIDAAGDVFAEFQGYGVYEATFGSSTFNKQLTTVNASLMEVDAAGDLFAEFQGYGVQELKNGAGGFTPLNGANASLLAVDAAGDVAAVFSGYGTYRLMAGASPASWQQLSTLGGSQLAIDGNGDVFVQYSGYPGVYRYVSPSLFSQVTAATPLLLTDDLAGDVFASFGGAGFDRHTAGYGFLPLAGTQGDASVLA